MRNTIAKRYSSGLFDLAHEKELIDVISNDCQGILLAFDENVYLSSFLQNPKIEMLEKGQLLDKSLKNHVNLYTYDFVRLLLEKGRIQHLKDCVQNFLVLADIHKGLLDVDVTSALKLDEIQKEKLQKQLEVSTNKKVTINNIINPTILGGLIIKIGNNVIDGSVKSKITKVKESLLKAQVMEVEVRE